MPTISYPIESPGGSVDAPSRCLASTREKANRFHLFISFCFLFSTSGVNRITEIIDSDELRLKIRLRAHHGRLIRVSISWQFLTTGEIAAGGDRNKFM